MSFEAALQNVLSVEGDFSDIGLDPGGKTKFGISEAVARVCGFDGTMESLPLETAGAIYRQMFWDLIHLDLVDRISPAIAVEMFDTGVNCGVSVPVPFLQRALNAFNRQGRDYPDVPVDGLMGSATAAALKAFLAKRGEQGERVLLSALNAEQAMRYLEIVEKRPASEEFIFGWFANRVAA